MFCAIRDLVSATIWLENHVYDRRLTTVIITVDLVSVTESIDYLVRRKNTEQAFKILKQIDNSLTYNNQMQISLHHENQAVSKSPVKIYLQKTGFCDLAFLDQRIYGFNSGLCIRQLVTKTDG